MLTILEERLNKLVSDIRSNMASKDVNASGATSMSLAWELTPERITVYGSGGLKWLETGRPPYQGGPESDLKGKILNWTPYRGIGLGESEARKKAIAYVISRQINDFGTLNWQKYGSKGQKMNVYSEEVEKFINEAVEIYLQALTDATRIRS